MAPRAPSLTAVQNRVVDKITITIWVLYIAGVLGLWARAPQYLADVQFWFNIYVCLYLMLRFNPFRRVKFTGLDAKISFAAALFMMTSSILPLVTGRHIELPV